MSTTDLKDAAEAADAAYWQHRCKTVGDPVIPVPLPEEGDNAEA
jgi:hypothetical protein